MGRFEWPADRYGSVWPTPLHLRSPPTTVVHSSTRPDESMTQLTCAVGRRDARGESEGAGSNGDGADPVASTRPAAESRQRESDASEARRRRGAGGVEEKESRSELWVSTSHWRFVWVGSVGSSGSSGPPPPFNRRLAASHRDRTSPIDPAASKCMHDSGARPSDPLPTPHTRSSGRLSVCICQPNRAPPLVPFPLP